MPHACARHAANPYSPAAEAKDEKFMSSSGLEASEDEFAGGDGSDDDLETADD